MVGPAKQLSRFEQMKEGAGFLIDRTNARQIISAFLKVFPWRIKKNGVTVFIRCWSDILAYLEIFKVGIYDACFAQGPIQTYCDLGCQSGFAFLRLSSLTGGPLRGLLVDANPRAIERCKKNISFPEFHGLHLLQGVVGGDRQKALTRVPFVLRPNELECSLPHHRPIRHDETMIEVPVVDLEKAWLESIGPSPCDLLKIDIEGAEKGVLRTESSFLARVSKCVLEWHGSDSDRQEIYRLLESQGFGGFQTIWEGPKAGVFYCHRASRAET